MLALLVLRSLVACGSNVGGSGQNRRGLVVAVAV